MAKSIKHYLFVSRLDTLFLVSTAKMLTTTATAQMGYSNTTPHCATLSLDKVFKNKSLETFHHNLIYPRKIKKIKLEIFNLDSGRKIHDKL